jgi:hypothetical protein
MTAKPSVAEQEILIGFLQSQGHTRAAAVEQVSQNPDKVRQQMEQAEQKEEETPEETAQKKTGGLDAVRSDRTESPFEPGQQPGRPQGTTESGQQSEEDPQKKS